MAIAASLTAAGSPLLVAAVIDRPILVVVYGVTIAVSAWLFRDARRRGRSAVVAVGWAVGGFVLPGVVHFGYLYGRMGEQTRARPSEDD
ncbi:MAG: hypothetical protein J07HN4v3_00075 [Halonotius sp. J07HN4]|nr:MAG: hypothetical protein J07HN4v3_00075 [Halonotius sp. J07HN4]